MRARLVLTVFVLLGASRDLRAQNFTIGTIDFFGLRQVSVADAKRAVTFKEGDTLVLKDGAGKPGVLTDTERNLVMLPGVAGARTNVVCCDGTKLIVYIGVVEKGSAQTLSFLPAPAGAVRLADEVVEAGKAFDAAFAAAIERRDFEEDHAQGHALFHDPAARAVQERFVGIAARNTANLREVLRDSAAADQRAHAAQILAYVADKQSVVDDLVRAMRDPDEDVRNNAMRALFVFTRMTTAPPPRVPFDPFVQLLNSPVWTDRNKSSLALGQLSARRDPALLRMLRDSALDSLVEIAQWKTAGHAQSSFMILGRIASLSDEAIQQAWDRGDRQSVIDAAKQAR